MFRGVALRRELSLRLERLKNEIAPWTSYFGLAAQRVQIGLRKRIILTMSTRCEVDSRPRPREDLVRPDRSDHLPSSKRKSSAHSPTAPRFE